MLTCHWVHFTHDHALWDVVAFVCLGAVCERLSRARFVGAIVASSVGISAAVWFVQPELASYRGLSGVDSALFGLLAAMLIRDALRRRDRVQLGVVVGGLLLFAAKVAYEAATGGAVFTADLGAGVVAVPLAHVVGAAVGAAVGGWRRS